MRLEKREGERMRTEWYNEKEKGKRKREGK